MRFASICRTWRSVSSAILSAESAAGPGTTLSTRWLDSADERRAAGFAPGVLGRVGDAGRRGCSGAPTGPGRDGASAGRSALRSHVRSAALVLFEAARRAHACMRTSRSELHDQAT